MTLLPREHPEARDELRDAALWYEEQQLHLGDDFFEQIDATIQRVLEWPEAAPFFAGWEEKPVVRAAPVSIFPYRVFYYLTETSMVIVAYAHDHRKPGYWQRRLDG